MSDDLEGAIRAARNALDHPAEAVKLPTPDWSRFSGAVAPSPDQSSSDKGGGTEVTTPAALEDGNRESPGGVPPSDPVWSAVGKLKSLWDLLPATPAGESWLGRCITKMRHTTERELFPNADPNPLGDESLNPIEYPRLEVNKVVRETRHLMLVLLPQVEFERRLRELLGRELSKPGAFLEEDDRGTIQGFVEPSGPTSEKMRNDTKLHALGVFLDALRRQPFAVVRCAAQLLSAVAIPPDVLSADTGKCIVIFRRTQYLVSEPTAYFVQLLLNADGGLVSIADVAKALKVTQKIRPDRLKEKLPDDLVAAIVTTRKGSRLDQDRLLSHV